MQSSGGLTTDAAAVERPMDIIESGPAGGVVGAQALARARQLSNIITFDMGGTTAKASIVEDGEVTRAAEYSVGAGIMIGSRLLTGAGYTLKVPAIDLAEVGAGGGSHVWIDPGGSLQIGPESAGAHPGPVCYDQGGTTPTVTDANVLLGYLNPEYLVGGAVKLNAEKARTAFEEAIARPLRMSVEQAAYGAHQIAASNMIRAIKAVSTERGRDAREFALFAFGGNGPLFACGMAEALGMSRVVVPPCAGLFSSFGLLYADVEHHYGRTFRRLLRKCDLGEVERAWATLAAQADRAARGRGLHRAACRIAPHRGASLSRADLRADRARSRRPRSIRRWSPISRKHSAASTRRPMVIARDRTSRSSWSRFKSSARASAPARGVPERVRSSRAEAASRLRRGEPTSGAEQGWLQTPVIRRAELSTPRAGPVIVEEYDATCVIPPGWRAALDNAGKHPHRSHMSPAIGPTRAQLLS